MKTGKIVMLILLGLIVIVFVGGLSTEEGCLVIDLAKRWNIMRFILAVGYLILFIIKLVMNRKSKDKNEEFDWEEELERVLDD